MVTIVSDNSAHQFDDDPALLDRMLEDMAVSPEIYRPTNYWQPYCDAVVEELRRDGLADFRRRQSDLLSTFGIIDQPPHFTPPDWEPPNQQTWDVFLGVLRMANGFWEQGFGVGPDGLTLADHFLMCERIADAAAHVAGLPPASELSLSRHGNPFGYESDGGFRTLAGLHYFHIACFAARHGGLEDIDVVVEIGSGRGGQAEVLKRLLPDATVVLLDLAPQLYVAERFLSKAFAGKTVPYDATRPGAWDGKLEAGKIHFLAPRQVEDLTPDGRVLFWNAASFGEMEPAVVANYAGHVSRFADVLMLMQFFDGKQQGSAGLGGVLEPVTMKTYETAFPGHERVAMEETVLANGVTPLREGTRPYHNTLWRRRA